MRPKRSEWIFNVFDHCHPFHPSAVPQTVAESGREMGRGDKQREEKGEKGERESEEREREREKRGGGGEGGREKERERRIRS